MLLCIVGGCKPSSVGRIWEEKYMTCISTEDAVPDKTSYLLFTALKLTLPQHDYGGT